MASRPRITSGQPNAEALPAAAMLMAAHGIGPAPDIKDIEVDDEATRLTKLLVAAGSLLTPPSESEEAAATDPATGPVVDPTTAPVFAGMQPGETSDPRPMTATEMLTNAIEILRRLDEPPADAVTAAKPDDASGAAIEPAIPPAPHMAPDAGAVPVVILPEAPDFVGPMPAVVSTPQQVAAPPSATFVGPMPVMMAAPRTSAPLSSPEFVGPMPELASELPAMSKTVMSNMVLAPPAAEFVGPMPAVASAAPAAWPAWRDGPAIPVLCRSDAGHAAGFHPNGFRPTGVRPLASIQPASIPLSGETASSGAHDAGVSSTAGMFAAMDDTGSRNRVR